MSNTNLKDMEIFKVTIDCVYYEVPKVVKFGLDKSQLEVNFYQNFIKKLLETEPSLHLQLQHTPISSVTWKDLMGNEIPVSNDIDMVKAIEKMYSYEYDVYKFHVHLGQWNAGVKTVPSTEEQAQFKVYAHWSDGFKPEVRRFGVDKSMVTSFVYITAKIQDVLPSLKFKTFSVTWKDEEGDDVTISTDEEMMTALTSMSSSGLIKLNIYVKESEVKKEQGDEVTVAAIHIPSTQAASNTVHFGVVCDGCDDDVTGFRYKCTVCDDFDLCSKCEYSGLHTEHCMVRIPVPQMPRHLIKDAIRGSRHFLKTVSSRTEEDPASGKRAKRDKSNEKKHHRHGQCGDRSGGHHRRRHSWLDTFGTYLNEFANLAGDVGLDTKGDKTEQQKEAQTNQTQPEKPETAQSGEGSTASKCPFNLPIDLQQIQNLMDMYLQNAQAYAQQAQAQTQTQETSRADASVNAFVDTSNASVNTNDVEMMQHDKNNDDASSSSSDSNADDSAGKVDDWTVIKEKELMDAMASAPLEPAPAPGFIPINNLPQEFQEHVRISEGQNNLYPPLNTATAVLDPKEVEPNASAPPEQKPAKVEAPRPAPPAPRMRHPVPHIDAALEAMLAMGFTNDDGWLIQLLEKKNGDIPAVLDLLTPVAPKK